MRSQQITINSDDTRPIQSLCREWKVLMGCTFAINHSLNKTNLDLRRESRGKLILCYLMLTCIDEDKNISIIKEVDSVLLRNAKELLQ